MNWTAQPDNTKVLLELLLQEGDESVGIGGTATLVYRIGGVIKLLLVFAYKRIRCLFPQHSDAYNHLGSPDFSSFIQRE